MRHIPKTYFPKIQSLKNQNQINQSPKYLLYLKTYFDKRLIGQSILT